MALQGKFKEVGQGLLTWWASQSSVQALSLVRLDWARGMRAQPAYPCNPRTQCPRGLLRAFRADHTRAERIGCPGGYALFVYNYSLWVQLKQTPGQDHQELLLDALAAFRDPLLQTNFDVLNTLNVAGLHRLEVQTIQEAVYDELDHEFGDPNDRVSTGEINFTLTGEVRDES